MGLNIAIIVLVCVFAAWLLHQSYASPLTTLTVKDVQVLRDATLLAKDDHTMLQQLVLLLSRQNAQIEQLVPALHEMVDAMNGLATQNIRVRTEVERATAIIPQSKNSKK